MRSLLALLAIVVLAAGIPACGGTSHTASRQRLARDRDNDGDNNDDDAHNLNYGHAATGAEQTQITRLVRGYYAAAAAGDGARACSLLYPLIAETIAEDYSHNPAFRGRTCTRVLTKVFRSGHAQLAKKDRTLRVYAIRVSGRRALMLLTFAIAPEVRQMLERRVGDSWKIASVSDDIIE